MKILSLELRPLFNGEPWSFGMTVDPIWKYIESQGHIITRQSAESFYGNKALKLLEENDVILYQNTQLIKSEYYIPEKSVIRLGSIHPFNVSVLKSCSAIILTSNILKEGIGQVRSKDVYLIPNGLDLDEWKPIISPEEFIVGYSAHHGMENYKFAKGFDIVYSACQKASVKLKTAIYPDTFIPHKKMYDEFYSKISCFVLPSLSEGCNNCVMESMACGIPVIISKVGYHGDNLINKHTCLFTGRFEGELAGCITRLKNDALLYDTLRNKGREFAEQNHNHKMIAEAYLEIFNQVNKNKLTVPIKKSISKISMNKTPNILLIADRKGWAYDTRCQMLKRYLSNDYNFEITYFHDYPVLDLNKYDLIYFAGYNLIGQGKNLPRNKVVTSISGMVSYSPEDVAKYINQSSACSVFNRNHLSQVFPYTDTTLFYIPNGVDTDLFCPIEREKNEIFTIGWAGNSKHKGKRLEELKWTVSLIPDVKFVIQDMENKIPHIEMPKFYQSLDCYCQVSISEGCSNTLLEAAACGIPLISTSVGTARDIIESDGGYLVRDDLSDLQITIELMKNGNREAMGKALRNRIVKDWTWEKRTMQYKEMFDYVLRKK
jgi:glycosyltransferase involved in cell wall biosynthesis